MSPAAASQPQQNYGLMFLMSALCWLWISFADGPIFFIMSATERTGYLLYVTPVAAVFVLALIIFRNARLSAQALTHQAFILAGFGAAAIVQKVYAGGFDFPGYLQLYMTFALCFLISKFYQDNAAKLGAQFANSILWIHYFLCGYCVLAWLGLNFLDISIEIRHAYNSIGGSSFGFARTSGFHRESAWAGQAIAATFLINYSLRPRKILPVTIFFVAGVLTSGSATGLLLAFAFAGYIFAARKEFSMGTKILVGVLAIAALVFVFRERIQDIFSGLDPSTSMRIASARPALDIVRDHFPFGAGYGNFRDYAVYDSGFSREFIDLEKASYYKSDVAILNILAELGVMGAIMLVIFARNFYVRTTLLIMGLVIIGYFSGGTLVSPPYFALAAFVGLQRAIELQSRPARTARPLAQARRSGGSGGWVVGHSVSGVFGQRGRPQ